MKSLRSRRFGLPTRVRRSVGALASSCLIGCGGSSSPPPLAPDPTEDSPIEAAFSETSGGDDGVAPSGESTDVADRGAAPAAPEAPLAGEEASPQPGSDDSARALLMQFVAPNADHAALTRGLRPTSADYKALFDGPTAKKVESAQAKAWKSDKAAIKPKPGQTEVKLWSATGSDLAKGVGNAREFPGDYNKIAKHLVPTALFFRFKFVEAGKDTGTAYDGLAYVNGHWVIAPKPWRALEGQGGLDADAETSTPAAKRPAKKKRGGKNKKKRK